MLPIIRSSDRPLPGGWAKSRANLRRTFGEPLRFAFVGGLNTVVDAAVYLLLTRLIPGLAALPGLAKGFSYSAGVINSYWFNRRWTFRSAVRHGRAFWLFAAASLAAMGWNALVMRFALVHLGLPEAAAFAAATLASLAWNYSTSKFIVFTDPHTEAPHLV